MNNVLEIMFKTTQIYKFALPAVRRGKEYTRMSVMTARLCRVPLLQVIVLLMFTATEGKTSRMDKALCSSSDHRDAINVIISEPRMLDANQTKGQLC